MKINPKTLKKLRETKGYSQQALADEAGIDKKTIVRIEGGKGGETRGATAKMIAKALGVNDFQVLAEDPESETVHSEEFRILGARRVKVEVPLFDETILAYDLVQEHYGVDMKKLINAAPVLFTLLAELSLADRSHRLKEMETAWQAFEETRPEHLLHLYPSAAYYEQNSIDKRDLFGRKVLKEGEPMPELYHGDPFSDFLIRQAEKLGRDNDAIKPAKLMLSSGDPETDNWFWNVPLFETYQKSLTGGSARANYALSRGYTRIGQIPKELRPPGEDEKKDEHVTSERVKWLEAQVSDEDWDDYERFQDSVEAFAAWREKFSAGSARANYALCGYVELDKIPEHLHGETVDIVSERVKWLEAQVPDEVWNEDESISI